MAYLRSLEHFLHRKSCISEVCPTAYHAFVVIKNFLLIDLQIKVDHQIHISFVVAEPFLDCVQAHRN